MGRPVSTERREALLKMIADGSSVKFAAKQVNMAYSTARGIVKGLDGAPEDLRFSATKQAARRATQTWDEPIPHEHLCAEAQAALADIGYFARRYFGLILMPWHHEATEKVVALWVTPRKEYVVVNLPPGVGKSTFFTLVLPAWLTCRDRTIRGLIGSAAASTAKWYTGRLRDAFTASEPITADDGMKALGLACDAESTLLRDFGLFKPVSDGGGLWTQTAFDVRIGNGQRRGEKENTWQAFGQGQAFIGARVPFTIWDDVYTEDIRTPEARAALNEWWDGTAETRLEPGGLLILQGQRLHSADLYRHALDKVETDAADIFDDGLDEARDDGDGDRKQYHHIVFKAHYEDRCKGNCTPCRDTGCAHATGDADCHGDPDGKHCNGDGSHCRYAPPYPAGCLLYPGRLPWSELARIQKNTPSRFAVVYQQEDVVEGDHLIDEIHLAGGTDADGAHFPGCRDYGRELGEWPRGLKGPFKRIAVIDPSPENWWAIQDWLLDAGTNKRYLLNMHRAKMRIPDLLTSTDDQRLAGLMPHWQVASMLSPVPIGTWLYEKNSGNRFIMQIPERDKFIAQFGVDVIAHETGANKTDPMYGVTMLAPHYRHGRVSLPYKDGDTRATVMKLEDELTHWPDYRTDDQVMANWFFEHRQPSVPFFNDGNADDDGAPRFTTLPTFMTGRSA